MTEETQAPLTNSPEARTPTGEIIDQGASTVGSEQTQTETPPSSAPETYADFKAPEGQTLDPKLMESASPLFKELGLTQDAAQKLVDFYAKNTGNVEAELYKQVEKTRSDWRDQVKSDPVIGKDLTKTLQEIGRAKDKLPSDVRTALNEAMDYTGAGDHPAVVRALYEFAKLVNEGIHVNGVSPSPLGQNAAGKVTRPSLASSIYPNLPQ